MWHSSEVVLHMTLRATSERADRSTSLRLLGASQPSQGRSGSFGFDANSLLPWRRFDRLLADDISAVESAAITIRAIILKKKPRANQPSGSRFLFAAKIAQAPPNTTPDAKMINEMSMNSSLRSGLDVPARAKGNLCPIEVSCNC